jgi:glycosyltransferase involved in cell wall biosynthesis
MLAESSLSSMKTMSENPPLFTVIIPVYNDWEVLRHCLAALEVQSLPKDEFEVIVINNRAEPELPQGMFLSGNTRLMHQPVPGSYAARNLGASAASGFILAFTDADCIPDPRWLESAKVLFQDEDCGLIAGHVDIFRRPHGSKMVYAYEKKYLFRQEESAEKGESVIANLFVRRHHFEEAGGFDASIKSMGDLEFTRRCAEAGYKMLYGEKVSIRHPARTSVGLFLKRKYRVLCWKKIHEEREHGHSGLYTDIRTALIQLLLGLKKSATRRSCTGKISDTARIRWLTFMITFFELFARVRLMTGLERPERIRE